MIFLPFGEKYKARSGAEQGDPLASMQCGCVIADIVVSAMADMKAQKPPGEDLACFGFWYADGGQYDCRLSDVDLLLRCLIRAAALAGRTRGAGRDVKSTVRLIGDATAIASFHELQEESWITDKIRDTCQILEPNSTIEVLGTTIGFQKDSDNAFG